jgi:hypothetical protein
MGAIKDILAEKSPGWPLLLLVLLLVPSLAFPQQRRIQNMPSYDDDIIHFGFILGYNSADFVAVNIKDFHAVDTVYDITPAASSGFNLQIVTNLRLGENFDLRFLPGLSFAQRNLNYTLMLNGAQVPGVVTKSVESTFVEFPLNLKFKSNRINNFRMYLIGGFKYSLDLASRKEDKNSRDKQPVKIENTDYGYEIGVGMDIYLVYIKMSPEIKMFTGMKNLIVKDEYLYSSTLEKLYSKIFTFSLTFE